MRESEQFLEKIHRLDGQALAALHDAYYPKVYRYARYRLDSDQAAEDAAGETFLRLLHALRKPNARIKDIRSWLFGTAFHLVQDYYREKYRNPKEALEDHHTAEGEAAPEHEVADRASREEVRRAIRTLSPDQQHVLALRFSQDLSLEETAALMGKNVNAVKVLQFRALQALRQKMTTASYDE